MNLANIYLVNIKHLRGFRMYLLAVEGICRLIYFIIIIECVKYII